MFYILTELYKFRLIIVRLYKTFNINFEAVVKMEKTNGQAVLSLDCSTTVPGSSCSGTTKSQRYFLALHLGAGKHSKKKQKVYEALSTSACEKGLQILKKGGSADDAVVATMQVLENSKRLNAGKGSNLTMDKTVECDAGFMSGNGRFGGIGAVSGVPNPCIAARKLTTLDVGQIVPPNLLVGEAARRWAASMGIRTCDPADLVCIGGFAERASKIYARFVTNKDEIGCLSESDTLGVIATDRYGHAAGVGSTGGGLYKLPGRVGPIAQHGCGLYVSKDTDPRNAQTAFAATGLGEFLTETRFAASCDNYIRSICQNDPVSGMKQFMDNQVIGKCVMNCPTKTPVVGVIGFLCTRNHGELVACHNSDNMIYAFGGNRYKNVQFHFSAKKDDSKYKLDCYGF